MFLDPFTFTPPSPEVLTRAVESYQRVAAARFCRYARDAEDPFLLPKYVRGDTLQPTSKQLHAEIRVLRHLTAIQRTLREIGGPLFDPDSPISPEDRFRLVDRRLDAIDEALKNDPKDNPVNCPSPASIKPPCGVNRFSPASTYPACGGDGGPRSSSCSSNHVNHVNPVDSSSDDRLRPLRPLRSENSSSSSFYHPPEIEDLLEAANFAQTVFAARAELLDKRRLELSSEDFLLEIASLRDLTAIVRTLRRMSARPLPERQTHEDVQKEFAPEPRTTASPGAPSTSSASSSSNPVNLVNPVYSSPSCPSSHASSESVDSVKSVDGFDSSSSSSPRVPPRPPRLDSASSGLVNPVQSDLRTRPVPRVPEVRTITPRRNGTTPSPQPAPDLAAASPSDDTNAPTDESCSSCSSYLSHQSHQSHQSHDFPDESSSPLRPHAPPILHDKDPP